MGSQLRASIFDRINCVHFSLRANDDESVGGFVATAISGALAARSFAATRRGAVSKAREFLARKMEQSE